VISILKLPKLLISCEILEFVGLCHEAPNSFTLILCFSQIFAPALVNGANFQKGYVLVSDNLFMVDIASDMTQSKIGLSNRNLNKENYFMVFILDKPQKVSFWMKNTKIDLSIAFINEESRIVEISNLKANSLKQKISKNNDIKYALEVPKGYFIENQIRVGDYFQIFK
jgi:uncharacterized membrane protein (UPF0127 family)